MLRSKFGLIGLLLVCAVGFSIFKIATSFGPQNTGPRYSNLPPSVFAAPPPDQLVDPKYIYGADSPNGNGNARLPDDVENGLFAIARTLAPQIQNGTLNAATLQHYGIDSSDASTQLSDIAAATASVHGQQPYPSGSFTLNAATRTDATISTNVNYVSSGGVENGLTFTFGFSLGEGGDWQLTGVTATNASSSDTSPSIDNSSSGAPSPSATGNSGSSTDSSSSDGSSQLP